MNKIVQTEIISYRKSWIGRLYNNEYYYVKDYDYDIYERTLILDELPEWYNNTDERIIHNDKTKLDIIYDDNLEPFKKPYNTSYYYNNNENNWIVNDNTLHKNMVAVTEIIDNNDINIHLNTIKENYLYNNLNDLLNSISNKINYELIR